MTKYLFLLAFILPFMAIGQVTMHPTNITFDSKGRVDSVYYEKDSTVKGTMTGTDTTKPCDRCWPKIDTTKHVSENMLTIDGNIAGGVINSPLWWEPDTCTLIKLATKGNHKHVGREKKHSAKIESF